MTDNASDKAHSLFLFSCVIFLGAWSRRPQRAVTDAFARDGSTSNTASRRVRLHLPAVTHASSTASRLELEALCVWKEDMLRKIYSEHFKYRFGVLLRWNRVPMRPFEARNTDGAVQLYVIGGWVHPIENIFVTVGIETPASSEGSFADVGRLSRGGRMQ